MPNFQEKNWTVIPSQDVVLNNTDNMRSTQEAPIQAQARSQIFRNYTNMPKYDGVSVDKDNI